MEHQIEKLEFGRTGHQSSRVIFGGAALSEVLPAEADRVFELLLHHGVNHIDTSVTYGDSEKHIGRWMPQYRDQFFLATKIDARRYSDARRELDTSLTDLKTEQVDLLQMHELVRSTDANTFFSNEGAVKVLDEAKAEGLTRFSGVTAHGFDAPRILQRCVKEYAFDAVLLPFNYYLSTHPQYRADFDECTQECHDRGIAVQTIKSIARGPWGKQPQTRSVWYQPLEEAEDIDKAVQFVLSFPQLFLCSVGDIGLLPRVLEAAASYDAVAGGPSSDQMEKMRKDLQLTMPGPHGWPRLWDE